MEKKLKRTLFGYSKKWVENKLDIINANHGEAINQLENELAGINNEITNLLNQISKKEVELNIQRKEWDELEKSIFDEYINNIGKISVFMEESNQATDFKKRELESLEYENNKIKNAVNELIGEIQKKIKNISTGLDYKKR